MKLNLKSLALSTLLLGSASAFAQLTVEDNVNERTNGLNDGQTALTYNFPAETEYKLLQEGKNVLLQGSGVKADLGVLVPGEYWMQYEREDGKIILDKFEVKR
jgi:hypothetical protein